MPEATDSAASETCPPSRSVIAGDAPLYGTSTHLKPAVCIRSSMASCANVPWPAVP